MIQSGHSLLNFTFHLHMYKAKVLWVENDINLPEMQNFKALVESKNNVELVSFTNSTEACQYLENNIELLSGAILDMESFPSAEHQIENPGSFNQVTNKLNELKNRNELEYFVFSGKGKYSRDQNFESVYNCKIFDKNHEIVKAISYVGIIVERHNSYKIKKRFAEAFSIFDTEWQGEKVLPIQFEPKLVTLVNSWGDYSLRNSGLFHGLIRPITEKIIKILEQMKVLPEGLKKWNERSRALDNISQKHPDEIPCYIARAIHTVFDVCPEGIHDCPLFDNVNKGTMPYLLQSLTLELFNILAWFPIFVDSHLDVEENKKTFLYDTSQVALDASEYEGKEYLPIQDEKGNYHCGPCLINPQFWRGGIVKLKDVCLNTRKETQSKYPFYAKVEKI